MFDNRIKPLRYWVQKVLPLVYDDSLSYYELLNRVVCKLNDVIGSENVLIESVDDLSGRVNTLEITINDLQAGGYDALIRKYISEAIKMVFFGLTDSGYFVAYIPDSWKDIKFNTTEYDIYLSNQPDFGHLVLSMEVN